MFAGWFPGILHGRTTSGACDTARPRLREAPSRVPRRCAHPIRGGPQRPASPPRTTPDGRRDRPSFAVIAAVLSPGCSADRSCPSLQRARLEGNERLIAARDTKAVRSESSCQRGRQDGRGTEPGERRAIRTGAIESESHHQRTETARYNEGAERESHCCSERPQAEVATHEERDQVHFRAHAKPHQERAGQRNPFTPAGP